MYGEIRFQTGEAAEVALEMKKGLVPCLEVNYMEEFDAFVERLREYGIFKADWIPYDKTARNRVIEPEFEFRAAFSSLPEKSSGSEKEKLMYLDVYFEEEPEETYDPIGEI